MMTRTLFFIWLLILIPGSVLAKTLAINDTTPTLSAEPYLLILEDPGQQFTLEQSTSADTLTQFKPYLDNIRNLGLKDSAWWLRLDIQREDTTGKDWYAQFKVPILTSESDAYFLSDQHPAPVPLSNMQEKPNELRLYTLKLPALKKFTLIIRINNYGDALVHFPLQILDTEHLHKKIAADSFLYGGIMVSLFVLAIYNLFLFFSLRYFAYLTLSTYLIASILLVQKTSNAIPLLSFLNDPTTFYHSFNTQLILVTAIHFWRQLTYSKNLFPYLDKIAWYLIIFMVGITPFISLLPYANAWSSVMITSVLITVTLFCILSIKKNPSTLIGLSLPFITTIICSVPIMTCSLGFFLRKIEMASDIFSIGILCATILLSLTLAEQSRQLRIEAERAKAESKSKDKFLATMSHELRTPMHTTTSIIQLLKTTSLSNQQNAHIRKLETSTNHTLELINNVLDLARSKSNELQLEKQPFSINDLLSELENLIDEKARKKQLTLTIINNIVTTEQRLIGDAMRLKQTLLNLLDNAIKFTETGSVTLTITPCGKLIDNTQSLKFVITDTGIGISNSQKKRIFEAFTQADSDTTRKYGGSGLGLSISRQLIKCMGGKLILERTDSQGSRFSFTLAFRLSTTEQKPLYQEKLPARIPDNICVLLVEDDALNRMLGAELLTAMGFTCVTASDGEDALQQLPKQRIDLVLMDISMPNMDGYQAAREIRAQPRFTNLPIIALTAHSIEDGEKHYRAAGMNDYLCKPCHPNTLMEKVLFWTGPDKPAKTQPLSFFSSQTSPLLSP